MPNEEVIPKPTAEGPGDVPGERYFCVHCQDADVQRSDEDLCCLTCGVDLVALADLREVLSRAGLALVPAVDVVTPEDRAVLERENASIHEMNLHLAGKCAAIDQARGLLERIVNYAREDRATTPGVTRLARVLEDSERWLAAHPATPAVEDDEETAEEADELLSAGQRLPFVQVGMVVHHEDSPLSECMIVTEIYDANDGMEATVLSRFGEPGVLTCRDLRQTFRLARDFDQRLTYTGRWGRMPRGAVVPEAEVERDA